MTDYPGVRFIALLFCVASLAGCVSTPVRPPLPLQQAARHVNKGIRADTERNYALAEVEFMDAYRLYSSVEDYAGMITTLINSSRLYRHEGRLLQAEAVVDRALLMVSHAPELSFELWFEKGRLLLSQSRAADARLWAEKALAVAPDSARARMLNLLAEIYIKQMDFSTAERFASEALRLAGRSGDRSEEANASRLLGDAYLATSRFESATEQFNCSLLIDKELALPERIAADLYSLASVAVKQEKPHQASVLMQRAVDVKIAGGIRKGLIAEMQTLILVYESLGDNQSADRLRTVSTAINADFDD